MATAEELNVIDAEFTEEETEALDDTADITPYQRLDRIQGMLSDPAKALAAFGGMAIDALAIEFKDRDGRLHWSLTAEGVKAFLVRDGRPFRIEDPKYEEFEVKGNPWTRCIARITMQDDASSVADVGEKPREDQYGKTDPFAGRSAFTQALARCCKTLAAGMVGLLERYCTEWKNQGLVIIPGEAPEAIRVESGRAQAGRADERLAETPRIGKEKARELQDRMNALYRMDKARFGNIGRELENLKKRLTGGPLKLERLPSDDLKTVEDWLAAKERELADANAQKAPEPEADGPEADPFPDAPTDDDDPPETPLTHIPTEQEVRALIAGTAKDLVAKAYELAGLKPSKPIDNPDACRRMADALYRVEREAKDAAQTQAEA